MALIAIYYSLWFYRLTSFSWSLVTWHLIQLLSDGWGWNHLKTDTQSLDWDSWKARDRLGISLSMWLLHMVAWTSSQHGGELRVGGLLLQKLVPSEQVFQETGNKSIQYLKSWAQNLEQSLPHILLVKIQCLPKFKEYEHGSHLSMGDVSNML